MDVTKESICIISASGTTDNVSKWKHGIVTQCCSFSAENLNFKTATLLKLGLNYS